MKKTKVAPKMPHLDSYGSFQPLPRIPVLDIPGLGTFQTYHGNEADMEMNGSRITLLFDASNTFYELCSRYNSNEAVNVLDFVNAQRQLKARMFALKSGSQR